MKLKSMLLICGIALAAAPVFAADATQVRLINAVPQSQDMSVKIGSAQLFDNIKFNEITAYKTIPQQDDKTVLIQNGGQELKTTEKFDFDDADENYSVLITPDPSGSTPKVVVLESDREQVESNEVEINLINASPNHKSIKLRLNDDVKESGVNYADVGDTDVKPGIYNLAVLDASGSDTVIATRSVKLIGGTAITVLLTSENHVKIVNDMAPQQEVESGAIIDETTTGSAAKAATKAPATMTSPAMSM